MYIRGRPVSSLNAPSDFGSAMGLRTREILGVDDGELLVGVDDVDPSGPRVVTHVVGVGAEGNALRTS